MSIESKLAELGIALPDAPAPAANYVPYVISGNMLFVSGQISALKGRLGDDVSVDQGAEAARGCGLSLLAQAKAALGSLDRVARVVKLGGFVNSTAADSRCRAGRLSESGTRAGFPTGLWISSPSTSVNWVFPMSFSIAVKVMSFRS